MSETDPLAAAAEAMRQVRVAYDRYFMGLERVPPLKERDAVKIMLQRLVGETQRSTANKFRLQTLQNSWTTWEAFCNRVERQIEEGTYKRDKQKTNSKLAPSPPDTGAGGEAAPTLLARAAAPSASAASPMVGMVSAQMAAALHKDFEAARKLLGLGAGGPSLVALTETLNKQTQLILAQYKCQSVDFKVAIKDGKPILKATPH